MLAEFKVLFRVLELMEGEVQGRQSARPPPRVERSLQALLSGELDEGQRRQLCEGTARATQMAGVARRPDQEPPQDDSR